MKVKIFMLRKLLKVADYLLVRDQNIFVYDINEVVVLRNTILRELHRVGAYEF